MKQISLFLSIVALLLSQEYKTAEYSYEASGSVTDMVLVKNSLYVATSKSCVDVFNITSKQKTNLICVDKIEDFMGKKVLSKVYSVDALDKSIAILSQDSKGYRRVHLYKNKKLKLLISNKDEFYIAKIRFLTADTLLLGLLENEILSYNIRSNTINWRVKVSLSKFSDFVLSEDKKRLVVADESGDLKIFDTRNATLIATLSGKNLNNVFQVDYKNGIIATAGQDRRVVVYDTHKDTAYYKSAPFLIYSVGLSPSGKKGAYSSDENNNVTLFDTESEQILGRFSGNKMTLTKILFLNENEFFVASDDKSINFFKLK